MDAYSYPQQQQQQQQQEQQQQSQSQQQQQQQQIQSNFQVQSVLSPYNNIGNENIPRQRSTMLEFLDDEARRKYREKRDKNNLAAKKSRSNRRERERQMQLTIERMSKETQRLTNELALTRQRSEYLESEMNRYKALSYSQQEMLLRDNSNFPPQPPPPGSFMYPPFPPI
ncbi:unnamed protein product [Dracunculus medinensis]|uniref:BZIP domain-containing protein n=1 Tax=Dracunculus medinensis TaxID=318479 RepID=A0A0N4UMW5_DRAME|nr:unnamed protein product [Dracunculus medinensis]